MLQEQKDIKYYKVKKQGSDESHVATEGYVYFSESYIRLTTRNITVHKDALPKNTSKKLNL